MNSYDFTAIRVPLNTMQTCDILNLYQFILLRTEHSTPKIDSTLHYSHLTTMSTLRLQLVSPGALATKHLKALCHCSFRFGFLGLGGEI